MKIQYRITATIAITLFTIIFIASFTFTQLFVISNRNTQLLELSQQNKRLALSVEKKNFENPGDALEFLGKTDYLNNIENIIGVKILLADTDMNILINPTDMDNKDLKDLILKSRQINRFFTISDLLTASEQIDLGKMIYAEIDNSKYYISIQEFKTDSQNFLSVFLKQQNEVAIPPLRYIFNLAFIFLIAGLISILTGLVLGRSISDPILRLNRSVSRISNGDYSEDIQAAGLDEIGVLAQNINIMKNKIERSQESLKEFTYILSHEIKNMITSINGYAVGISEGVYSTEEEINEALNIIRNKSGDLENITESLLMLSKIENRIIDISREEIKITDIVDELVKLYEQELERNRLSITKLYRLPENMKLRSDRYLIQTVISNLINNAIKYSSAESEIVIDISSDTANVIFSVSNRGQEISEDEKDKIFNMFYRSKKYDFKNIKGFGLGLAISRKISSILNAKLDFVSNADVNTFIFKIPLNT